MFAIATRLYDPLDELRRLGLRVTRKTGADGAPCLQVRLTQRLARRDQARARFILRTWRGVLLMQLDVEEGATPRTVQQLLARGVLVVSGGRYRAKPTPPR